MMAAPVVRWPQAVEDHYRAAGYWTEETFDSLLHTSVSRFGNAPAVVDDGVVLSYRDLAAEVDALANGLARMGLQKGDCVVVQLPNCHQFVVLCFALMRLGVVPVFALPAHRQTEITAFCRFVQARAYFIADVVGGFDYRTLARAVLAEDGVAAQVVVVGEADGFVSYQSLRQDGVVPCVAQAADVACLLLSGGSTGIPKLIPRRHCDYLYNVRTSVEVCGFGRQTVYLAALPVAHNFPMACPGFFGTLMAGGTVVLAADPGPDTCLELIDRHGVTDTALVPPLVMLWLDAVAADGRLRDRLRSLRCLQVGGAKLVEEVARRITPTLGCRVQQVFGMAEGLICYTRQDDPDALVMVAQGRPMSPADEVRVVDDSDHDVADGAIGQLLTRGPYTIRGYYQLPEHNAVAFTEDGFYRTGDLVRRLPDGSLVVEGRVKDQINRGGEKISAEEVENLLLGHPSVFDVAVVAMPDKTWGELSCAFVIPRGPAPRPLDLTRHLRAQGLAAFKIPDRIQFIDAFPATGVGKTSRRALRDALQAEYFSGPEPEH
ncbi:(2,3-dihydroxybenzoyl)adenylate synthase [Insolitispirillum peregrinum]|uniref:3-methylmercaptopropionyl-CoA ligase n=1 Tax=Insolitispirillum peregrinum TaxID=80876 RepID=A0A1N7P945_9PROT|nr:AMP-binding protein [Insolitispirillum peregrinum]SIT07114.1 2,3-dihydroxybenzoate-AMP ligase/pyochelin biosynthesis protein PchD [Insolitispirillum peregrinum]